jgi:hypothetical protein
MMLNDLCTKKIIEWHQKEQLHLEMQKFQHSSKLEKRFS